ncbi:hypothetical protein D1227_16000 [Henriciella mobilis]|uniref:hypothetical protein n=1 Tax=Henriciella mobilis TaxID=2305467 RepID=UPI000E660AAA|nr:hypothetical protein [Henriciella mobilis]RIJ14281.1 hypothetical protein D1231_16040 [Henriciella mobilis]RIJ19889.1 hypothetical protein D1227_16000 [Henriciella mobilis]
MWRNLLTSLIAFGLAAGAVADESDIKLKTGESIDGLSYGVFSPLFSEKQYSLTVSFLEDADSELREKSRKELVTRFLIPSAVIADYKAARLSERQLGGKLSVFSATVSQDWTFQHADDWQWKQVSGPTIDWSIIQQEYVEYSDRLDIPSRFLVTTFSDGRFNLVLNGVAKSGVKPEEALLEITRLADQYLQCDESITARPDIFSDPLLNGIYFYAYPAKPVDGLTVMPRVHISIGPTDGEWLCSKQEMVDSIAAMDWSDKANWVDIWTTAIKGSR